jgi:uncharacterized membrane protein
MDIATIVAVLLIGFAAGLRALTPPAVLAWCAFLAWINLDPTPFSFMSSWIAVGIFTLIALGEYIVDLFPNTPNRTAPPGLIARFATGSFSAACLLAATNHSFAFSLVGAVAAIGGAFVGYQLRVRLVRALKVNDALVAIPEDVIAICLSIFAVCIVARP